MVERYPFDMGDGQVARMTCSVGFAAYPFLPSQPDALSLEQVVAVADRGLYIAKKSGRNAWVGFIGTESAPEEGVFSAIQGDPAALERGGDSHLDVGPAAGGPGLPVKSSTEEN